jgi:hypothetical protein
MKVSLTIKFNHAKFQIYDTFFSSFFVNLNDTKTYTNPLGRETIPFVFRTLENKGWHKENGGFFP